MAEDVEVTREQVEADLQTFADLVDNYFSISIHEHEYALHVRAALDRIEKRLRAER